MWDPLAFARVRAFLYTLLRDFHSVLLTPAFLLLHVLRNMFTGDNQSKNKVSLGNRFASSLNPYVLLCAASPLWRLPAWMAVKRMSARCTSRSGHVRWRFTLFLACIWNCSAVLRNENGTIGLVSCQLAIEGTKLRLPGSFQTIFPQCNNLYETYPKPMNPICKAPLKIPSEHCSMLQFASLTLYG